MVNLRRYNKAFYDDFAIHDHAIITRISEPFFPPMSNTYLDNPNVDGSHFRTDRLGQLTIEMELFIEKDVSYHLDELRKMLYSRINRQLVVGDKPNRYLMCKLDGEIRPSSRFKHSEFKLKFVSPDYYWRDIAGDVEVPFGSSGRAILENIGTAPTPVSFRIKFPSDCGYIGIFGPYDRYQTLGNIKEEDKISVKPTEFAMNEEFQNATKWTAIKNAETYIPDYNKMTSKGSPKFDQWGMLLDPTTSNTADVWNGHAVMREFDKGSAEVEADNFELLSRVDFSDKSGKTSNTMAALYVMFDENNTPIMSTSVYDVSYDKNELVVTFKIHAGNKRSKIIYTGKLSNLNGYIKMTKHGNKFDWEVYNSKSITTQTRRLQNGDVVHLKPDTKHIYDVNGTRLRLDQSVINQRMTVRGDRGGNNGQYLLYGYGGSVALGYFNADQIQETTIKATSNTPTMLRHSITDGGLGQLRPKKLFIWQAKWGAGGAYSQFSINSAVIKRLYTVDAIELENTFMAGDILEINGRTDEVLLNGNNFNGLRDYDSRIIFIEGGKTELGVIKSDWAAMPEITAIYESRWF